MKVDKHSDKTLGMSSSSKASPMPPTARRRRKRSLPVEGETFRPASKSQTFSVPDLDDTSWKFLDSTGDFLTDRRTIAYSLPMLLEQRRTGKWTGRQKSWQFHTLKIHVTKPLAGQSRRQWRPFGKRSIPFTKLGTLPSDAALALDRQGSFILSLGSKNSQSAPLALALRFYGIPSPHALSTQQRRATRSTRTFSEAPLLQTTPLLYDILDESPEETIFNYRRGISPATTPVKIVVSSDWRMGVAMFQPSNVWREDGPLGTMVLFSTPTWRSFQTTRTTTWQCTNVKMGSNSSFSPRNLLWKVYMVPVTTSNGAGVQPIGANSLPGYLYFNDEDDGFRLTWVVEQWTCQDTIPWKIVEEDSPLSTDVGPFTPILLFEDTWERFDSNLWSGGRMMPATAEPAGFNVISEAYLHINILLKDILSRRKTMTEIRPKDFVYNLISVSNAGRVAEIIITFMRTPKRGSLGVFVCVDLFTGLYRELSWMKNLIAKDPVGLRNWCNALALNRRMKDLRVGPYAVRPNHSIDWSKLCIEETFDLDEDDNFNASYWKDYVTSDEAIATRKPPKFISHSLLYPDCDLVTNKAIIDCVPVGTMQGRDSPTKLVYG